ncbi:heme ABC exporter ATP-binding protein CcmA [Caulobacter sp. CCUG 60055]|uniref:heme ABC exporter ATP-binding protein CcmA n=2 Tax=Pseudomonadota TaxID=1224 RepID=UPI001FA80DD7|nr:heme ABC exporter ATP-binding protein CcmA [Caulobacter sp. CCUG 60055]MBQ1543370.1 heme ABC exporter ATP-binding protein CcmA [Caulobacteraceae bacterium]MCI3179732.1 heme ABC exporter ATP-binding protein CcmA [Caulobacter sp. CCUG 60055]
MISSLHIEDLAVDRGDRRLFAGFGLDLRAGEAVALVGRNGAGKTSLLRAVAGFVRPAAGRVRFAGAAGDLDPDEARSGGVHLLGHHDGLKTTRTAWEELLFQVRWTGGSRAGAEAARERLDLGPLCDLEVRKLSAGQRRRLALARLVASPRALWLLDEPLAPLDAARRAAFGALMAEHLAGGGLILAAVHDPLPIAAREAEIGA